MDTYTRWLESQLATAKDVVSRVVGHADPRLVEAVFVQMMLSRSSPGGATDPQDDDASMPEPSIH